MAKGICPVCNKEKGVRPSSGKLFLHRVTKRGKTCIGSGKIPVEEGEITMVEIGEVTEVSKERLAIWDTVLERQRVQGFPAYSRKSHSKFGLLTSLGSRDTGVARCIACGFMFQEWTTARSHECPHEERFRLHTGRKILTKKIRKSPKKADMTVLTRPGETIVMVNPPIELKVKLAGLEKEFKDISIELDAFYTSKDTPVSEGLISRLSKQWGSKPPGNESMFPQS